MPNSAIAPHGGATLPPDPALYVFVPSYYAKDVQAGVGVTSGGDAVSFSTTVMSKTPAFWSFRIDVETDGADAIDVKYGDRTATYSIDPDWTAPAYTGVKVRSATYVNDAWTCSHTDAHFLTVSDAPAYLVEWSRSATGKTTTVVVPHHTDDMWLWGDREPPKGFGKIGLGHLNCMGESAKSGAGYTTRFVRVRPLFPDGTRGPWAKRVEIDETGIVKRAKRTTKFAEPPPPPPAAAPPPLPPPPAAQPNPQPQPPPKTHPRLAATPRAFDAVPLLGLAAFLFGFALARTRVRRSAAATRERVAALARFSIPQVLCAITATGAIWLALHAATAADAGAAVGFSVAGATWAAVAGATAALSR